jgi:hypothetical protein
MPTSPTLTEQLATLGVHLPDWPEEPEGGGTTGDWIQLGQAYAEGVRLWRAQLRNAPESTKGLVDQLLRHFQDTGQLRPWDQLVYSAIKPEVQGSADYERWQACTKLIRSTALTPAQLLGMALEMAREHQLETAIEVFKRLLNEHSGMNEQEQLHLCSELVATINTSHLIKDAHSSQEGLERVISLHEQMAGLLAIAADRQLNAAKYTACSKISPLSSKLVAINYSQRQRPEEVDRRTWSELLLNAYSTSDPRTPNLLLIESRSLPRSGHHFLKQLLSQSLGHKFSYCEAYQEPGCCKNSPCSTMSYWHHARTNKHPHLRLVKSHDFSLQDTTFDPMEGMVRLIQIRKPFDLLASWLELQQLFPNQELLARHSISLNRILLYHEKQLLEDAWQLIDNYGCVMTADGAKAWLHTQSNYVKAFLGKWLPLATPFPFGEPARSGNFLLCYNDLSRGAEILQTFGLKTSTMEDLPKFRKRRLEVSIRQSIRVTDLLQAQTALLNEIDAMIMESFSDLIGIL